MGNKTFLVAQREYLENVRTKTFLISIFIVPVLLAASFGISALLNRFKEVQRYTVLDLGSAGLVSQVERTARTGDLEVLWKMLQSAKDDPALQELAGSMGGGDPANAPAAPSEDQAGKMLQWISRQDPKDLARLRGIQTSRQFTYVPLDKLALGTTEPEAIRTALNQRVQKGELFAYFVLGADPVKSLDGFAYVSNNLTDGSLRELYERALTRLVQKQRITDAGIAPALAAHIQETVSLRNQYSACSSGKLHVEPSSLGAIDVRVNQYSSQSNNKQAVNEATTAALVQVNSQTGQSYTSLLDYADMVLFVTPELGDFLAYASVGGGQSVYNDKWGGFVASQMHETG